MGRNNLGKWAGALALGCGGQSAEPAPTGSRRAPLSLELQSPAALQRTRFQYSTSQAHCDIYKCYTQGMKKMSQIKQKPRERLPTWTLRSHWVAIVSPHQQWDWHGGPNAGSCSVSGVRLCLSFFKHFHNSRRMNIQGAVTRDPANCG